MTRRQVWLARGVAMAADGLQLALFPLFAGGAPAGADLVVDLVTGAALTWLCGFHWAFLPTLVAEAAPMLDLFPSWTAAVLFVTRRRAAELPPEPPRELPPRA
ncbi:MAG TPA: hypothetical protein VHU40_08895 [Polyangia bacterium]|jgi:hypothetical protein|nr:hypothetical protein [Polyangia bacterium]